jgi:hypothetical protein
VNENTRLSTALFEDAITDVLRECHKNTELVEIKIILALANWALAKMGNQSERYLIRAVQDFVAQAAKPMVQKHRDAARALREIPLVIPTQHPGSNPSLYQLLTKLNLLQIRDDYEDLTDKIRELKGRNKTDAFSFRRDLKKILNGCNQDWITKVELTDEPSDIATLYLTKKHRQLGIKPEMLKKRLASVRDYAGSPNMKDRARTLKQIDKITAELLTQMEQLATH